MCTGANGMRSLKLYLGIPILPPVGFEAVYTPVARPLASGVWASGTMPEGKQQQQQINTNQPVG